MNRNLEDILLIIWFISGLIILGILLGLIVSSSLNKPQPLLSPIPERDRHRTSTQSAYSVQSNTWKCVNWKDEEKTDRLYEIFLELKEKYTQEDLKWEDCTYMRVYEI